MKEIAKRLAASVGKIELDIDMKDGGLVPRKKKEIDPRTVKPEAFEPGEIPSEDDEHDAFGVPKAAGKDDIPREEGPNGAYDIPFPVDEEDYLNTMKWYDRKEDGDDLEKEDGQGKDG